MPVITLKRAKRLRRDMTLPEVLLWRELRRRQWGMHFRKQHPIGPYVLDFYCSEHRLAVEVDGAVHDLPEQARHDERRDAWLRQQGIRLLRFRAADVLNGRELEGVLQLIEAVGRGDA
jgi:very-short-patch-repair endonuclease